MNNANHYFDRKFALTNQYDCYKTLSRILNKICYFPPYFSIIYINIVNDEKHKLDFSDLSIFIYFITVFIIVQWVTFPGDDILGKIEKKIM